MTTTQRERLSIPWGLDGALELGLPECWPIAVVRSPDLSNPLRDYGRGLDDALNAPLGGLRLEELVRPESKVAIVVDDPSRWTPVRDALPLILARLTAAGVGDNRISISVGVGRHHAVDANAMRRRVGADVVERFTCYSPPLDDVAQYAELGTTSDGVPVRVFKPVVEADVRVLIGSVLPHLQAGFGGGYKLIFPGCCQRETLGALHRRGLGHDHRDTAALLGGDVAKNPMRQAIRQAAAMLPGTCFSVSHVIGAPGEVFRIGCGDVDGVQAVLSDEARRRFRIDVAEPADLMIAGNYPWPGDPLMSFKVLLNHRAAVRKGGVMVGLFWTDPAEMDRSMSRGALHTIAGSGAIGGWLIRKGLKFSDVLLSAIKHPSRFMLRWARELVGDRHVLIYSPEMHRKLGPALGPVHVFDDLATLWRRAERLLAARPKSTYLFPISGLTYVSQEP